MNCYITLDYELCLGRKSGTAQGCLIEPMRALTTMLDKYEIKVNVMVDAAYLLRMKQLEKLDSRIAEEFILVSKNIKELAAQGHAVQLHFHPQWIHTSFHDGTWIIDMNHYKLSDLDHDEMRRSLRQAIVLLNEIAGKDVKAFRAGGFSIENFADVSDILEEFGIHIDTSVLRYAMSKSAFQTYNYSNVPSKTHYNFSSKVNVEEKDGRFTEYPISVRPYNSLVYLLKKKLLSKRPADDLSNERWNDGIGAGYPGGKIGAIKQRIKKLFGTNVLYASFDGNLSSMLLDIFEYAKNKYTGNDFVIISHPKSFTPASIHNLEKFIILNKDYLNFSLFN